MSSSERKKSESSGLNIFALIMYGVTCNSMRCNHFFRLDWKYGVCPRCGRSTALALTPQSSRSSTDECPSQDDFPRCCLPSIHTMSLQTEPPTYCWPSHTPHNPPAPPRRFRVFGDLRAISRSVYRIPTHPRGMFLWYPETGNTVGRWVWHAFNERYNL